MSFFKYLSQPIFDKNKEMDIEQFLLNLKSFGIDFVLIISGCSGAVSLLTSSKKSKMTIGEKISVFLAGGLSANYLTPLVINFINLSDDYRAGFGYVVGYSGLKTVELFIKMMHNRIDTNINSDQNENTDR